MGIGVSLILIAAGAILTWAVNATVSGVDINAVGVILMVIGAIGLVLSLVFWSSWGGPAGARRRTTHLCRGGAAGRLAAPPHARTGVAEPLRPRRRRFRIETDA